MAYDPKLPIEARKRRLVVLVEIVVVDIDETQEPEMELARWEAQMFESFTCRRGFTVIGYQVEDRERSYEKFVVTKTVLDTSDSYLRGWIDRAARTQPVQRDAEVSNQDRKWRKALNNKKERYNKGDRRIPEWAKRERDSDLGWILENEQSFRSAARQQYQEHGRGAIVVDTTTHPPGMGHPFTYYTQAQIIEMEDVDAQRMVREYDPEKEMVIVLLKPQERVSIYRVRII